MLFISLFLQIPGVKTTPFTDDYEIKEVIYGCYIYTIYMYISGKLFCDSIVDSGIIWLFG